MTIRDRLFTIFTWWVVVTIFIGIALFAFWELYPYEILEFSEGNGMVAVEEVTAGKTIALRQNQCKYKELPAQLNRQFVNDIIYSVNTIRTNRPLGCHSSVEYVYVPMALPTGFYRIRTVISYKVNPIRTITYTVLTNEFHVTNPNDIIK